jgi:hypothetical protein
MTNQNFRAYKNTLYNFVSEMTIKLYSNATTGKSSVDEDFMRLKLLLIYVKILDHYNLTNDVEDDLNMFTRQEMQAVVNHLNKLTNSNYNIDLVLE